MEVERSNEEALNKTRNLSVIMSVVCLSCSSDKSGSKSTIHCDLL